MNQSKNSYADAAAEKRALAILGGKIIFKMAEFAVMRWTNDGNRVSVHNLKWVIEPKDVSFKVGTEGVARFCGYPGLWQFRILRIGGRSNKIVFF